MRLLLTLSPTHGMVPVNILAIACDCGVQFAWPSHVSLVSCPHCGLQELWHGVAPKCASGPWSEPEMAHPSDKSDLSTTNRLISPAKSDLSCR